ncbi:MAG: FecR domain-containing protein [Ignavibacteria bacterium]|nr:FecR domain-containing protein [Ignavibacteria bacterium]
MKKIIFIFAIVLFSKLSFSQPVNHSFPNDSLLFDGFEKNVNYQDKSDDQCVAWVTYYDGDVKMMKDTLIPNPDGCDKGTQLIKYQIEGSPGERTPVIMGTPLKTGKNSHIEITFGDGRMLRLGPESQATVECLPSAPTVGRRITVKDVVNLAWMKLTNVLGGEQFQVEGRAFGAGPRGTIFSVEVINNSGIVTATTKVYEHSVFFIAKKEADLSGISNDEYEKKVQELQDEYKAGKITAAELQKKVMALVNSKTDEIQNKASETSVIVTEGNMSKITYKENGEDVSNPTKPEPFTDSGDQWWADKFYGKK